MAVEKQVKEYSKRQRINLNKSDGFTDGDIVMLMSIDEYEEIKKQLMDLNTYKAKVNAYEKGNELIKNIQVQNDNDKAIENITNFYEKELAKKDNELSEKDNLIDKIRDEKNKEINRLKDIFSNYEKRVYGLNPFDVILRRNKKLSDDFHNSIWIISNDEIEVTESKSISNKSVSNENTSD